MTNKAYTLDKIEIWLYQEEIDRLEALAAARGLTREQLAEEIVRGGLFPAEEETLEDVEGDGGDKPH